mgnify:CR=1 FL=1
MTGRGFEEARANLDSLISWWTETGDTARNEATTRLDLIDELLLKVLAWPKAQVTAEDSYAGQYTDYALSDTATRVIVEAKKEGVYFDLPAGVKPGVVRLDTVCEAADGMSAAVEQVLRYCQDRGVPLAVVCNGHQLVAFVASRRDGIPPLKGRALVFPSLSTMRESFQVLWDNLSPAGVELGALERTLGSLSAVTPPEKLSARVPGYPGSWARNNFST